MIGKIVRGDDVGGLLRYLYGPGRANEHLDPHLAGAWDEPQDLEPARSSAGRHDLSRLARLLEEPLHAATRPPTKPVWHCALRAAPADRRLSDAEWDEVAREVLHRSGLATRGDEAACRWIAVRHADDHIHLVVTLARQDGQAARPSNDYYRVGEACQAVEKRYDLVRTPDRNRTAAVRPTRAETEKAARQRRPEPTRATLRRDPRLHLHQLKRLLRRWTPPPRPTFAIGRAVLDGVATYRASSAPRRANGGGPRRARQPPRVSGSASYRVAHVDHTIAEPSMVQQLEVES